MPAVLPKNTCPIIRRGAAVSVQGHKQGPGRRKQWFALTVGRNIAAVSAVGLVYVSMEKIGASAKSAEAQVSVSMVDSGVDVKNVVV